MYRCTGHRHHKKPHYQKCKIRAQNIQDRHERFVAAQVLFRPGKCVVRFTVWDVLQLTTFCPIS